MTALEFVAWLTLVDAIILIARTLRPEMWARYCVIAGLLERLPPGEDAARARLLKRRWVKVTEAENWDPLLGAADERTRAYVADPSIPITLRIRKMQRRAAQPPPDLAAQQRIALAQEARQLEAAFAAALVGELRAERWESEATDDRAPLRGAGSVRATTWHLDPAGVVVECSEHAIDLGGGRCLRNMRLRRAGKGKELPEDGGAESEPKPPAPAVAKPAAPRDPPRGARSGTTNRIKQERRELVPKLRDNRRQGESYRATIERLERDGTIKLPGRGAEATKIDELARVWGEIER
jgi:hypothetical protein